MAADAVTVIKDDHRRLERLFARLQSGEGDRRALVEEVVARLTAHARAEETEVYPEIAMLTPEEEAEVGHAEHEHQEAEHLLTKVVNLIDSPHFERALTDFVEAVRHHVEEEENEVLPALEKAVDGATLEQLGEAFEGTRRTMLQAAGYRDATASPGDLATDLADATREELYEMARRADIPGRSGMNKEALAEALRERG